MAYVSTRRQALQNKQVDSAVTKQSYVSERRKKLNETVEPVKTEPVQKKETVKNETKQTSKRPASIKQSVKDDSDIKGTYKSGDYDKQETKTPVDNSRYNIVGQNLIPVYEEDTGLKRIGKDIVNYGVGTASRIAEAVPQAMMQIVSNTGKAIEGKPLDFSEKTLRNDILPPQYDKAL